LTGIGLSYDLSLTDIGVIIISQACLPGPGLLKGVRDRLKETGLASIRNFVHFGKEKVNDTPGTPERPAAGLRKEKL